MPKVMARRRFLVASCVFAVTPLAGPAIAQDWLKKGGEALKSLGGGGGSLGVEQIAKGLKEALRVGTETVTGQLGQSDGFNADPAIHIPLPKSLRTVRSALAPLGKSAMLDDLELRLNRAAEAATPKAKKVFWQAIEEMTIDDAKRIYDGPDDAATQYFRKHMSAPLATEMRPIVDASLADVGAIRAYDDVMGQYRGLPFVPDVKANLTEHVLKLGLDGIFHYVAKEEAAIRQNPAKRTTEILQQVFGR
jgi:Protein of unknown function (DUF4197)